MVEITSTEEERGPLWEEWAPDPRWSEGVDVEAWEVVMDVATTALQLASVDLVTGGFETMPRLRGFVPLWWEILSRLPGGATLALINLADSTLRFRSDVGPLPLDWRFASLDGGKLVQHTVEDVPALSATWGRLVATRAHDDVDMFRALVEALPEDRAPWLTLLGIGASSASMEAYRRFNFPRDGHRDDQNG